MIRVPGDEKEVKGSLRFNYMIPVPDECFEKLVIKDVVDEKYRLFVNFQKIRPKRFMPGFVK